MKARPSPPLAPDVLGALAAPGALALRARELARAADHVGLGTLFVATADPRFSLADIEAAARGMGQVLRREPESRRTAGAEGARGARIAAAEALLARVGTAAWGPAERAALATAGELYTAAHEPAQAARCFERAGDDARAADLWTALGDIERLEETLARDEHRDAARRRASHALREFERLSLLGAREAASRVGAEIPPEALDPDAAAVRDLGRALAARLRRGRALVLRATDGRTIRFARLPVTLGRDPACELPLRDAGVSRRHATIDVAPDGRVVVQDAGSRTGTFLGGMPLAAALPLPAAGEIGLGPGCRLALREIAPRLWEMRGQGGLDRAFCAYLGDGPIPLGAVDPAAEGLSLALSEQVAHLIGAPEAGARVDGALVGSPCDLVQGDTIDRRVDGRAFHMEVL